MSSRVRYLDELGSRGMRIDFYDPGAERHPLPAYPYRWAPKGFLTRGQLRQRAPARRPDAGSADLVEVPEHIKPHPTVCGIALRHRQDKTKPRNNNTGCPHPDRKQAE